jgi:predicted  nucleic acid-binding Zn-ribbon protein
MALYYTDCDDIVDPLDDDFDTDDWTTKQLEAEQKRLKGNAADLGRLILDLGERLQEMEQRASEIEDALDDRAEAEAVAS